MSLAERWRSLAWPASALAVVACLVVFAVWWVSGPRRAVPSVGTEPGRLFFDDHYAVRVWLPRPRRNLAHLQQGSQDPAATGRLVDQALSGLRFGPFGIPPAKEMTLAFASGEIVAAFRFGAVSAAAARLAGILAGNQLLRGGEILLRDRRLVVRWVGSTWVVESADCVQCEVASEAKPGKQTSLEDSLWTEELGWVALGSEATARWDGLSSGFFRLRSSRGGFRLERVSTSTAAGAPKMPGRVDWRGLTEEVAVAALREQGSGGNALLLLRPDAPLVAGEVRVPSAGAVAWGDADVPELPGSRWLHDLGVSPMQARCENARCAGLDERGLRAAELLAASRPSGTNVSPSVATVLFPEGLALYAEHLAAGLDGLLLVPAEHVDFARELARWTVVLDVFGLIELRSQGDFAVLEFLWRGSLIDTPKALP